MGKNVYNTKEKMNRPNQNPDILELAQIVDEIRNRLVAIHTTFQAFDDQAHIYMGDAQMSFYKDGSVTIWGETISLQSEDEVEIKSAGKIRLKGSKIINN